MSNTQKQRSATERLNDLEQAVMSVFQNLEMMNRDVILLKDAMKLLNNKANAIAKGANISDDTISALMVQNNVDELKASVDMMIARGILSAQDVVDASSYLVLREVDETGKVHNPRVQILLGEIDPTISEKLLGATVGQTILLQEGKLSVEVLEIYAVARPQAPQEQTEEAAPAPAQEAASS